MEEQSAHYPITWRSFTPSNLESPGKDFAPFFFEGFKGEMRPGQTIIDFGCGAAHVAHDFIEKGLHVTLVDISPYSVSEEVRKLITLQSNQVHFVQACLWQLPENLKSAYWIYCCNVLEYIPQDSVDKVLEQMASRMRFGGYVSISLKEELSRKKWVRSVHHTAKSKAWWEKKLMKWFTIIGEDALDSDLYFNCRVKKPKL